MNNVGLLRLFPRHWPEVDLKEAKQQIKNVYLLTIVTYLPLNFFAIILGIQEFLRQKFREILGFLNTILGLFWEFFANQSFKQLKEAKHIFLKK